ncbi:DUF5658 family protein [Thermoanaerobacter thermohydrosulfuricus]|uniref:DUF5658 family protein n=1 Tax=Thermoanaerobacter thermohydrosulfuricus TaxID=1516 RepID=UPI001FCDB1A4|nr:DUF5658 family protein [Thermoanaerobacter thermohydrosulfuricus]
MLYLLLLNAADGFLTYYGTSLGIIREANPLMRTIVNSPVKFFFVKIVLLSAVLLTAWLTLEKKQQPSSMPTILVLNTAVFAYTAVLFLHFYWLFSVFLTLL